MRSISIHYRDQDNSGHDLCYADADYGKFWTSIRRCFYPWEHTRNRCRIESHPSCAPVEP